MKTKTQFLPGILTYEQMVSVVMSDLGRRGGASRSPVKSASSRRTIEIARQARADKYLARKAAALESTQ